MPHHADHPKYTGVPSICHLIYWVLAVLQKWRKPANSLVSIIGRINQKEKEGTSKGALKFCFVLSLTNGAGFDTGRWGGLWNTGLGGGFFETYTPLTPFALKSSLTPFICGCVASLDCWKLFLSCCKSPEVSLAFGGLLALSLWFNPAKLLTISDCLILIAPLARWDSSVLSCNELELWAEVLANWFCDAESTSALFDCNEWWRLSSWIEGWVVPLLFCLAFHASNCTHDSLQQSLNSVKLVSISRSSCKPQWLSILRLGVVSFPYTAALALDKASKTSVWLRCMILLHWASCELYQNPFQQPTIKIASGWR